MLVDPAAARRRNEIVDGLEPRGADRLAREYPVLWEAVGELFPDLAEPQRALVASLASQLCSGCHEDCLPCWCNFHTPRDE